MAKVNQRHRLELADVLRRYGDDFKSKHTLCIDQQKALTAITQCRTSALGGHLSTCAQCNHQQLSYNSCRNRNCNKCQYTKQLVWVDKLKSNLPVCRYFHLVFTLPQELHKLFYLNQRLCYTLLFQASAQTLQKVACNPKNLGADVGAVSVLHTWGQSLTYHPHIHMLVPAGGLSTDETEWVHAGRKFFLPVKALSKVFRGVMWTLLQQAIEDEKVLLPENDRDVASLKQVVYAKNWNVYSKKSLAGPQSVVQYLGKYTHRVAISNSRLVKEEEGNITFRWKDYRVGSIHKLLTLNWEEFIGRFFRHVLPSGFYKIRYYGILASSNTRKREKCVALIGKARHTPILQGLSSKEVLQIVSGKNPDLCPKCKKEKMIPGAIPDSS